MNPIFYINQNSAESRPRADDAINTFVCSRSLLIVFCDPLRSQDKIRSPLLKMYKVNKSILIFEKAALAQILFLLTFAGLALYSHEMPLTSSARGVQRASGPPSYAASTPLRIGILYLSLLS